MESCLYTPWNMNMWSGCLSATFFASGSLSAAFSVCNLKKKYIFFNEMKLKALFHFHVIVNFNNFKTSLNIPMGQSEEVKKGQITQWPECENVSNDSQQDTTRETKDWAMQATLNIKMNSGVRKG